MPEYVSPGVFVEEAPAGARPIDGVGTSTAAFVGVTPSGPAGATLMVRSSAHWSPRCRSATRSSISFSTAAARR
jgi:hypothetical protein